jgi:hypothetical protein
MVRRTMSEMSHALAGQLALNDRQELAMLTKCMNLHALGRFFILIKDGCFALMLIPL